MNQASYRCSSPRQTVSAFSSPRRRAATFVVARELVEGRGLDPQWLPIHPASNGRPAPAGLTFRNGGRLRTRCPYACAYRSVSSRRRDPARVVFLELRGAEGTIPTHCPAHPFQNGPRATAR